MKLSKALVCQGLKSMLKLRKFRGQNFRNIDRWTRDTHQLTENGKEYKENGKVNQSVWF